MENISAWAISLTNLINGNDPEPCFNEQIDHINFKVFLIPDSLWIFNGSIFFRAAYTPVADFAIKSQRKTEHGVKFILDSAIGETTVLIDFIKDGYPVLHYKTSLKPAGEIFIPYWPRDVVSTQVGGEIKVNQVNIRSGLIYALLPKKEGAMLYFQNLTSLASYCDDTETSCSNVVGGNWPEVGFALPPAIKKPLQKNKEVIISDAYVVFDEAVIKSEGEMARQYLDLLAAAYLQLDVAKTKYQPWPEILGKGLHDLIHNPACWSQVGGHSYLNAYACDYATPPEIMVQLAVLLPLQDYIEWGGHELEVMKKIMEGLPAFYNKELGTIMRWHPFAADKLEGEEEQKKPLVMDSWYLHHPLLNLSRLALKGNKVAEELFLNSIGFAIKVARHFKYQWPVFYKMDTLEVVKAETIPGKGGEKDVAGLYAHVMLQAWELTKEEKYLTEAKKAAKTLIGSGFNLFYQANNTSFGAGAMLRLYKETGDKDFLDLSYLCVATIFKNVKLWDCNYGYGKNFPSFFALFPLNDAPYTAVYEEQEVFCALHDYLMLADGIDIPASISLLLAEYMRHLVDRAVYYYPPMLPREMLADKAKIGELNPDLYIALEDMQDGWEKCGQVGQEVYGAGNAFGIVPRHYFKIPDHDWMLYCDYPLSRFKAKNRTITFQVSGSERLTCRLMIVKQKDKLPKFNTTLKSKQTKEGHIEFVINGNQDITISW